MSWACEKILRRFPQVVARLPSSFHRVLRKRGWPDSLQYSAERLDRSSSAQLVLNAAADLQDAYCRMPLLTSPSTSYKLAEHVQVQWAPDLNSPADGTDFEVLRRPEMPRCCSAKRRFLRSFAGSKPPLENMEKFGLRVEIKYRPSPALRVKV